MSKICTNNCRKLFKQISDCFEKNKAELCNLDRVIGDGDHGESMARGHRKAYETVSTLPEGTGLKDLFKVFSRVLIADIGGAVGPIFGTLFDELGKAADDREAIGSKEYALGLANALKEIMDLGGAKAGDKTLVDALAPAAAAAAENAALPFEKLTKVTAEAALEGVKSTISMQAGMGRAHFLREKSVGYQDAGATSLYYLLDTICTFSNL